MIASRRTLPPSVELALTDTLETARQLGFLGPGPVTAHIAHALDLAALVQPLLPARALDLGSGGGVPGLVLLAALPELSMVLLDSQQRRTAFLQDAVARLGMEDRAQVVTGRAEEQARVPELRHQLDVVVARSFGPPATTAECSAPFLRLGGHLIVSEPPDGADRWPADGLALLGLAAVELPTFADGSALESHYAMFVAQGLCGERYPRRDGVPAKKPLFVSRET